MRAALVRDAGDRNIGCGEIGARCAGPSPFDLAPLGIVGLGSTLVDASLPVSTVCNIDRERVAREDPDRAL